MPHWEPESGLKECETDCPAMEKGGILGGISK
jgi:hypothetical protein